MLPAWRHEVRANRIHLGRLALPQVRSNTMFEPFAGAGIRANMAFERSDGVAVRTLLLRRHVTELGEESLATLG